MRSTPTRFTTRAVRAKLGAQSRMSSREGNVSVRYVLALGAALALLAITPITSQAKKPPSFARWSASEGAYSDSLSGPVQSQCRSSFGDDDLGRGTCLVAGLLQIWPELHAHWQRGIARISKPQRAPCQKAIRADVAATQTSYSAGLSYLQTHTEITATELVSDITSGLYKALDDRKNQARSKAIRICG
jgi:hypothetical protein